MCLQKQMSSRGLIESLVDELERGIGIVRVLSDLDFARSSGGESSIGAHIRHNLDFVNAVLNGIAERAIDYNSRARNPRIENDREIAIRELSFARDRLQNLAGASLSTLVMVRSEVDPDAWYTSTVSREIEFVHSHTVHHYALVSKLVASTGHIVDENLGVAPSTLRFRSSSENYRITELRN